MIESFDPRVMPNDNAIVSLFLITELDAIECFVPIVCPLGTTAILYELLEEFKLQILNVDDTEVLPVGTVYKILPEKNPEVTA